MTCPTPTQGAQSEAARVPRVSDAILGLICGARREHSTEHASLALDLRDERQASSDKDATIADLERRLADAEGVIVDYLARIARLADRAATAERRGFEAGRDAAGNEADRWAAEIDPSVAKVAALSISRAIRALTSPAVQEGNRHAAV